MSKSKIMSIRRIFSLTQKENDAIAILAELHSTSASEIVRQALREKLERDRKK